MLSLKANSKCGAVRKDGTPCTNKAKVNGACGLNGHAEYVLQRVAQPGQPQGPAAIGEAVAPTTVVPRHVDIAGLDSLFGMNSVLISQAINKRLFDGPTTKDGPGHIYMYYIKGDAHVDYRKVGRTVSLPTRRVSEGWPGATIIASWPCKKHKMAEHLIHLYLDYVRVERWVVAVGSEDRRIYLSFWKNKIKVNPDTKERVPTEFVADMHFVEYGTKLYAQGMESIVEVAKKLRVENPHTEWFKEKEDVIRNCIKKVIGGINQAYRDEAWPAGMVGIE